MSLLGLLVVWAALAFAGTWMLGVVVLGAWRLAWFAGRHRARLARWVPSVLLVPVVLGAATTLAVLLPFGHGCHCALDSALHLCLVHPARSLPLVPVASVVLAAFTLRAGSHLHSLLRRRRIAAVLAPGEGVFARVDEPIGNALSFALPRPRILVDRLWWASLRPRERCIVFAHEAAHLRRGDPVILELCGLLSTLLPTRLARRCVRAWREQAEEQADAAAARRVGDPLAVASLLVELHRRALSPALGLALHDGHGLEARVRSLVDGRAVLHGGSDLGRGAGALLAPVALLPLIAAEDLHFALEWLLRALA